MHRTHSSELSSLYLSDISGSNSSEYEEYNIFFI
jgi:hypothetical protein